MGHVGQMYVWEVVPLFRKAWLWCRVGGKGGWQQPTFHTAPPRGREKRRACSNSTFIKTYWRKTSCWPMAGGGTKSPWRLEPTSLTLSGSFCLSASMNASSFPLSALLPVFPPPFFSSFLSTSIYCCSNSCPAIATQPTLLICLHLFYPPILSPPLYQSPGPLFPLLHHLYSSTSCEPLTIARLIGFAVWKLCDSAPPSSLILSCVWPGVLQL